MEWDGGKQKECGMGEGRT